jgi:murein L,D-transpeptidase YafK
VIIRNTYKILALGVLMVIASSFTRDIGFKQEQLEYSRVRAAFDEREIEVQTKLGLAGIHTEKFDIYIRAFKKEGSLEVWAKEKRSSIYSLVETYKFCSNVGVAGPKRAQGDLQIPEGFYTLSKFNPESNYHLSLKVSYPNKSDSLLSKHPNLGGQIFIHGGCLTVGCIPITDALIEEVYIMAVLAKSGGQLDIPIHIFPTRMNYSNFKRLLYTAPDREHEIFWTNLRPVYQHFEQTGRLPGITINHQGRYLFSE